MSETGYEEAVARYAFGDDDLALAREITRKLDFDMLDYEIEELNGKPSAEQVERILDRFNDKLVGSDWYYFAKIDYLREAIAEVMGWDYLYG